MIIERVGSKVFGADGVGHFIDQIDELDVLRPQIILQQRCELSVAGAARDGRSDDLFDRRV